MGERDYEQLFQEVFRRSANAMVLVDDDGRYVDANPAAERLLRYPRDELLGRTIADLVVPEERADLEAEITQFAREGRQVADHGCRTFLLGDGRRLQLDFCRTWDVLPGRHLGVYMSPVATEPRRHDPAPPTPREIEVIGLLALGANGEQIAERLVLSPETVRTHIRNAMNKLGATTRAHLIAIAVRERLISL